jgi:CelD/BcsL family acetyltransferase involved in cellulose biosynthesis
LDLNLLTLDNQPIAFCYNYHVKGYVFGLRTAFDQRFASLSPGLVLQAMQIEDSIQRGDRLIDLAEGYLQAKRRWITRTVDSYRCTHYASVSWKAQLLNAKHWLIGPESVAT